MAGYHCDSIDVLLSQWNPNALPKALNAPSLDPATTTAGDIREMLLSMPPAPPQQAGVCVCVIPCLIQSTSSPGSSSHHVSASHTTSSVHISSSHHITSSSHHQRILGIQWRLQEDEPIGIALAFTELTHSNGWQLGPTLSPPVIATLINLHTTASWR